MTEVPQEVPALANVLQRSLDGLGKNFKYSLWSLLAKNWPLKIYEAWSRICSCPQGHLFFIGRQVSLSFKLMSLQEGSSKPTENGKDICEWDQEREREIAVSPFCFPESPTSLYVLLEKWEVRDLLDLNQKNLVKNIQGSAISAYITMII